MSLLGWVFKKPNFNRVEDAFALDRKRLWAGFKNSLETPQFEGQSIWLVVHFMDTFTQLQSRLEEWGFDYEIVSSRLNANELERTGLLKSETFPASLKLVLAELVPEPPTREDFLPVDRDTKVAMIVMERHPQIKYDQRLKSFAKSLPLMVDFGYFLALDDPAVQLAIDEKVIEILKQLGLNDTLISSSMVTKRLEMVLSRIADGFSGDTPCNSAQEWLQINAG